MALNIKDPATDRLAREVARHTGETITDAIGVALTERLQRLQRQASHRNHAAALQHYIDRGRMRATLDDRTPDEIIGYDENGLPA